MLQQHQLDEAGIMNVNKPGIDLPEDLIVSHKQACLIYDKY